MTHHLASIAVVGTLAGAVAVLAWIVRSDLELIIEALKGEKQ